MHLADYLAKQLQVQHSDGVQVPVQPRRHRQREPAARVPGPQQGGRLPHLPQQPPQVGVETQAIQYFPHDRHGTIILDTTLTHQHHLANWKDHFICLIKLSRKADARTSGTTECVQKSLDSASPIDIIICTSPSAECAQPRPNVSHA